MSVRYYNDALSGLPTNIQFRDEWSLFFDCSNDPLKLKPITDVINSKIQMILVVIKRSNRARFSKLSPMVVPLLVDTIICHEGPIWGGEITFKDQKQAKCLMNIHQSVGLDLRFNLYRKCFVTSCGGYGNPKTGLCTICAKNQFDSHVPIMGPGFSLRLLDVSLPNNVRLCKNITMSLWNPVPYSIGVIPDQPF